MPPEAQEANGAGLSITHYGKSSLQRMLTSFFFALFPLCFGNLYMVQIPYGIAYAMVFILSITSQIYFTAALWNTDLSLCLSFFFICS